MSDAIGQGIPLNCDRDPARWAREFNAALQMVYPGMCSPGLEEGWLIGWFANAMMCGEDTYRWRMEKEGRLLPSTVERTTETERELKLREAVNRLNSLANYGKPLSKALKSEIVAVADLLAPLAVSAARREG